MLAAQYPDPAAAEKFAVAVVTIPPDIVGTQVELISVWTDPVVDAPM